MAGCEKSGAGVGCLSTIGQASLQIDAGDVIKIILQFLKENNLNRAFAALQVRIMPYLWPWS